MALACPRCAIEMTTRQAHPIEGPPVDLEGCPACGGLWLDAHVIAGTCPTVAGLAERAVEILLVGRAGEHLASCPRCRAVPYEFRLMEDYVVDFCPACAGVWLDAGEYDPGIFTPRPAAAPTHRERSPYRAAAEKAERRREVLCRDCARPVVVAQSFMTDRGLVCHGCWAAREARVAARRGEDAASGPVSALLDGVIALLLRMGGEPAPPRR